MKMFGFLLLLISIILIGILRLNLPSNNVMERVSSNKSVNIIEDLMAKFLLSNTVADWRYIDLIVVKFACSERLNMTLIGLPFNRWDEADIYSEICE